MPGNQLGLKCPPKHQPHGTEEVTTTEETTMEETTPVEPNVEVKEYVTEETQEETQEETPAEEITPIEPVVEESIFTQMTELATETITKLHQDIDSQQYGDTKLIWTIKCGKIQQHQMSTRIALHLTEPTKFEENNGTKKQRTCILELPSLESLSNQPIDIKTTVIYYKFNGIKDTNYPDEVKAFPFPYLQYDHSQRSTFWINIICGGSHSFTTTLDRSVYESKTLDRMTSNLDKEDRYSANSRWIDHMKKRSR